jgi:hypothetical protein
MIYGVDHVGIMYENTSNSIASSSVSPNICISAGPSIIKAGSVPVLCSCNKYRKCAINTKVLKILCTKCQSAEEKIS